jgi:predicted ATPase/DNA-binding winged helix-turn-helix (wHTH) protein
MDQSARVHHGDRPIKDAVSFGPFRLSAAERLLERNGVPLQLGSRALDVLIVLVEHAGEVVSKKELMSRVWPDINVDEASLRVHVAGLRKALGEGQAGARYVTNIPGRGYCFVAPIGRPAAATPPSLQEPAVADQAHRLPPRLTRMVGRDEIVRAISEQLTEQRFVTILGPGGIGKTTVAVSIGHEQLAAFEGAVHFFDLGPLNDARLIPSAIASTFGLLVQSSDPTPSLISFLRDRRMLLILDSCEHVVEAAAALAERIFEEAPQVHILATSRESLRVEGEHVYRLSALDSPPEGVELSAAQTLAFPAAQLFVERAAASGHRFVLSDTDAPIVAEICRKLDGIALAIELAAGRVSAHGIRETAALLDNRFRLLWHGRRTALPRHQTLRATLDWSYDLLSELERAVLRRLSVFAGMFTLEAATTVAAADDIDSAQVVDSVGALVAKSLVSADSGDAATRYRLLDTTRAYASAKLVESGEADATARRHAYYYRDFLEREDADPPNPPSGGAYAGGAEHLGNVRAALEWSFFERGDTELGTALAAASARLFIELSLLSECHRWSERALAVLDDKARGTRREMTLQAALGVSLMFTKGNSEQVRAAYTRGLELADALNDRLNQLRLIGRLHIFHERAGDFHSAVVFAERGEAVAKDIGDPVGIAAAHAMCGISHHLMGDQAAAQTHLEAALVQPSASQRIGTMYFGFHHRNRARIALARTLWLRGCPDQAVRTARETVDEAAGIGHPVTLCIALIWAVSVYHWIGDWARAEESIERFIAHANRHSLAPYYAVGLGVKGELSVRRGDTEAGIDMLRRALEALHADRYELQTTAFNSTLAEGLALTGRIDQALAMVNETIALVKRNGDLFNLPELLRIRGEFLASTGNAQQAEVCFLSSLEVAGAQSALGWELRAATSLARLRSGQDGGEARATLAEIHARFKEGFDTADLKAAEQLLDVPARRSKAR